MEQEGGIDDHNIYTFSQRRLEMFDMVTSFLLGGLISLLGCCQSHIWPHESDHVTIHILSHVVQKAPGAMLRTAERLLFMERIFIPDGAVFILAGYRLLLTGIHIIQVIEIQQRILTLCRPNTDMRPHILVVVIVNYRAVVARRTVYAR
jgi:hypothetical protein